MLGGVKIVVDMSLEVAELNHDKMKEDLFLDLQLRCPSVTDEEMFGTPC